MKIKERYIIIFSIIQILITPHIRNDIVRNIFSLFFILSGIMFLLSNKNVRLFKIDKKLLLFILLIIIMIIRGAINGYFEFLTMFLFLSNWTLIPLILIHVFTKNNKQNLRKKKLFLFFNLFGLIIILNILLYFLNIKVHHSLIGAYGNYSNTFAQLFNINIQRTIFYFASGYQSYGMFAGLTSLFFILKVLSNNKIFKMTNLFSFIVILSGIFTIILTDTRGTFFFLLLIVVFSQFKFLRKFKSEYLIIFLPILAVVFLVFYSIALQYFSNIFSQFSRSGTIITGREYIWLKSIEFLFDPKVNQLLGYGYFGQAASGMSYSYSWMFNTWLTDHPEYASVHNFFLQHIYDIGYIGIITLQLVLFKSFKIINSNRDIEYLNIIFYLIIFIVLSGTTDLSINVYNQPVFFVSIVLFVFIFTIKREVKFYV